MLDLPTIIVATCCTAVVQGVLLLYFWFRDNRPPALALCGAAFIAFGVGFALIGGREMLSPLVGVGLGGASIFLAGALFVNTARRFERRRTPAIFVAAPPVIWLAVWALSPAMQSPTFRATFLSSYMTVCYALCAFEGWRGRAEGLATRWPLIAVAITFACLFALRTFFNADLPFPLGALAPDDNIWFSLASLAVFGLLSMVAFLVVGLTHDRLEAERAQHASVDPVTGALRRGAFVLQGERMVARRHEESRSACLALVTLATPSGGVSDVALQIFSRIAAEALKPTDLMARMGANEFACIFSNAVIGEAADRAQALIDRFDEQAAVAGIPARARAGIASTTQVGNNMRELIQAADQALKNTDFSGGAVAPYHPALERGAKAGAARA